MYTVYIKTSKDIYERNMFGKLNQLITNIDNILEFNRWKLGIPYNENIIEVIYKKK